MKVTKATVAKAAAISSRRTASANSHSDLPVHANMLNMTLVAAATNVMFSILAWTGKSEWLFALAVLLDDIAAAFATVAFVTFISLLVDRTYTATQYALLASIGTMGRTTLASSSGALVDWLNGDWGVFFIITALMVIPSLILLWFIREHIPN